MYKISIVDVDELINLNAFGNVVRDSVLSKNSNILSILSSLLILMMRWYNNRRRSWKGNRRNCFQVLFLFVNKVV